MGRQEAEVLSAHRALLDRNTPLFDRLWRRVKVLWFQYEITFGAYCFVWWEKLIVHAILVSIIFLVVYGVSRQVWAIHALCTSLLRQ